MEHYSKCHQNCYHLTKNGHQKFFKKQQSDNHIETGLPWKQDEPVLPYNRILALNGFQSLKKKIHKNPDFANLYWKQIDEYISLGHARKLRPKEAKACSEFTNYTPHQGVLNINKPGKVRVVFDASAKFRSTSLNNNLLPGIDLQLRKLGFTKYNY